MKKKIMLITILFLTIGFAAVSTTLILNGNSTIGTNQEDFDVYFSGAILDTEDVSDKVISEDKLIINYKTKELSKIGDTSILEYEVTNASKNYDANVEVTCTGVGDLVTITQTPQNQIIEATKIDTGTVTVTLNKNVIDEQTIEFVCTLNVSALERTELGEGYKNCEYDLGTEWTYDYTGTEEEFIVPCDGTYKIELWGAQGEGTVLTDQNHYGKEGGFGGYTKGNITLKSNLHLYIYVGQKGFINGTAYNGGGTTYMGNANVGAGGGGATDVRLVNGLWNNYESLTSRIMVAGAGGGSTNYSSRGSSIVTWDQAQGGAGGGLIAGAGNESVVAYPNYVNQIAEGGTQTEGGQRGGSSEASDTWGENGSFGKGGDSVPASAWGGVGSGGSGYYGGGGGGIISAHVGSGGGGSSFISGHNGCDAIAENSTSNNIIHTGQANHYSGYIFTDTIMVDGNGYNWTTEKGGYVGMPTYDGTTTMTGNTGNGYAKITLISLS